MVIGSIRLKNFRNHTDTNLEFGKKANVILGNNGEGKTNLLEALSYISLTKSFYASSDSVVLKIGESVFNLDANVISDSGIVYKVHIGYDFTVSEKVYTINNRRIEPFSSIIGKFPIVFLSPEKSGITFGGPTERRKFIDLVISQSDLSYFSDFSEYRKVLKQRNKVLSDFKFSKVENGNLLEPWNEQLVKFGSRLIEKRYSFVREFQSYITNAYKNLYDVNEEPTISYEPSFTIGDAKSVNEIEKLFFDEIYLKKNDEIKFGTTLIGPHRDEIAFRINNLDLRKYASQGQHKTFLVALKLAEFFYLKERCSETPILLLDDVFSELDDIRVQHMLKMIEPLNQTFITSTNFLIFDKVLKFGDENRKFLLKGGRFETNWN